MKITREHVRSAIEAVFQFAEWTLVIGALLLIGKNFDSPLLVIFAWALYGLQMVYLTSFGFDVARLLNNRKAPSRARLAGIGVAALLVGAACGFLVARIGQIVLTGR